MMPILGVLRRKPPLVLLGGGKRNSFNMSKILYCGMRVKTWCPHFLILFFLTAKRACLEVALPEVAVKLLGFTERVGDTISLSVAKTLRHDRRLFVVLSLS